MLEKPSIFCKKYFITALNDFLIDPFSLNFPIYRENRNLEPITIRSDVGHPVLYTFQSSRSQLNKFTVKSKSEKESFESKLDILIVLTFPAISRKQKK